MGVSESPYKYMTTKKVFELIIGELVIISPVINMPNFKY
jgi:hypothetical protein